MGRRRKQSDDGGGGVVVIGIVLIAILQFIKPILVLLVNSLALAGLPIFLVVHQIASQRRNAALADPENHIPDPVAFDWDEQKANIHAISLVLGKCEAKVESTYVYAQKAGLRRTDASDGRRFDQRKKEGAQLNKSLDELDAHIDRLQALRRSERSDALSRVPAWRDAHNAIINAESSWGAGKLSLWIYFGIFVLLLAWRPSWVQHLSALAIAAVGPLNVAFGPAALATIAAWVAFHLLRSSLRSKLEETTHTNEVSGWTQIEYDIRNTDTFAGVVRVGRSAAVTEEKSGSVEDSTPPETHIDGRSWYEILGVQESASPDDVNNALHRRVQKYHPDNVASLGPRLSALAEAETVAVNRAYQLAKKLGRV